MFGAVRNRLGATLGLQGSRAGAKRLEGYSPIRLTQSERVELYSPATYWLGSTGCEPLRISKWS